MSVFSRAASLAALPVATGLRMGAAAGKAALGADRSQAIEDASRASIEHMATTLSKARGPAMKFGQVAAMMAGGLPEDQAALLAPLSRLYEDAHARELAKLGSSLSEMPEGLTLEPEAVAAASLGQVHRGVWHDGTAVAVKIQYPDARRAVKADMAQIRALAPLLGKAVPSLDVKAIVNEHAARLEEELDYRHEGQWMRNFQAAWKDHGIEIPDVLHASEKILVTSWLEGDGPQRVSEQDQARRNQFAQALLEFTFESPRRVGASHADPHPGNYRLTPEGHLGVLDFGSIAQGAGTFTRLMCDTLILGAVIAEGDEESREKALTQLRDAWVLCGLAAPGADSQALAHLLDVNGAMTQGPVRMNSDWLGKAGRAWSEPGQVIAKVGMLRFPPEYLLEHRAIGGALALACSLDADVDLRGVIWQGCSADVREEWFTHVNTGESMPSAS